MSDPHVLPDSVPLSPSPKLALTLSDRQFSNFLEIAPDAVVIIDQDGKIVRVNRQAERMFGREREELIGQEVEILMPERFRKSHRGQRAGFVVDPRIRLMGGQLNQLWGLRKDGSEFPVEISLSPMPGNESILVGSIVRDVTEQRRMVEALREADRLKYEHDRCIGREIQQGLLPTTMPRLSGFEISGRSLAPNIVGGDCFDFIPLPIAGRDALGVLVADASGHGIASALLTVETRAYLRGLALTCSEVGLLLSLTNQCLCTAPPQQPPQQQAPPPPPPPPPGSFKPSSLLAATEDPQSANAVSTALVHQKMVPQAPLPGQPSTIASGEQMQNAQTMQVASGQPKTAKAEVAQVPNERTHYLPKHVVKQAWGNYPMSPPRMPMQSMQVPRFPMGGVGQTMQQGVGGFQQPPQGMGGQSMMTPNGPGGWGGQGGQGGQGQSQQGGELEQAESMLNQHNSQLAYL